MSLRPQPTRWFELLVVREDLSAALEALAESRQVELQSHGEAVGPVALPGLRDELDEFELLERRYGLVWPAQKRQESDERADPAAMLDHAMSRLRAWVDEAEEPVAELEALERNLVDARVLEQLLRDTGDALPNLESLSGAGPMLDRCLYRLPDDDWPANLPGGVITMRLASSDTGFLLAVGLAGDVAEFGRQLEAQGARPVELPDDLPGEADAAATLLADRVAAMGDRIERLRETLDGITLRHDIADAIGDIQFVRWYVDNVPEFAATEHFAWITGWTSEPDEEALLSLLADRGIKGLLHLTGPPAGFDPPLVLTNPGWMKPFEIFTGMLGMPGAGEADPTRFVAIAGPLMFGYMFGDVGHGAVVLVVGLLFCRRYPALRLLVAGGVTSIFFGFLFGSVFALEGVIAPLWLHPMEHPLEVFAVPLAGGAVLLLTGMLLDALQAAWKHRAATWWATGAGLVLSYVGLLGALWDRRLLLVSLLGAAWFVVGHAVIAARLSAAGAAIAELLEAVMQLIVNTISFVRVGAFALAHAGLSMAVVGVADVPDSIVGTTIILVLGNLLIIALEGLVVGIQTTRLVLFEFFVRFLTADGRPFVPLQPASGVLPGNHRRA